MLCLTLDYKITKVTTHKFVCCISSQYKLNIFLIEVD